MANEYGDFMGSRNSETKTAWTGGVIRFDSRWGYPRVHTNSAHISVGIKDVSINDRGELVVKHEGGPVVTMFASPDETLTTKGISVGLSGGGGLTKARFYDSRIGRQLDLSDGGDWLRIYGRYSNLWIGWLTVVAR